ncbi:hypothetical protein OIV83_003489 [Microbotryomycetes sp. JL201]|nr:hypothetical protein OIV83_003489 [Microbotryomycetes sp. JL201]
MAPADEATGHKLDNVTTSSTSNNHLETPQESALRRSSTPASHRSSIGALSTSRSHAKRRSKSRKFVQKLENLLGLPKRRKSTAAPHTPRSDRSQPLFDDPEDEKDDADTLLTRPFIKVRLATANMHDMLPNGDLSDFLGQLRPSQFRRRHHSVSSRASKGSQYSEKQHQVEVNAKRDGLSSRDVPESDSLPVLPYATGHPYHIIAVAGQECPTASGVLAGKVRTLDGRGWTSILEDWLCGPSEDEGVNFEAERDANELRAPKEREGGSVIGETRSGPYILVEKLRLMGIYCAVFVLAECRHLVTGVSAGRVTAGLVGGRVGNKGAVAISMRFSGERLLFVSAHLAAHAHAVDIRKANVRKIFDEMVIDDFTGKGPKAGSLPERFDTTFFMGDLNFRLNVTRQHADWLIKNKDITNGLAFDQLREILADPNGCFRGFKEGEITFAPTYKYDVSNKVRKKRSALLRADKQPQKRPQREWVSYPAAEVDPGSVSDPEVLQATRDKDPEDVLSLESDRDSVGSGLSDYERIEKDGMAMPAGTPSSPPKGNPTSVDIMRRTSQVRFINLVRNNSAAVALSKQLKNDSDPKSRKLSVSDLPPTRLVRPVLRSAHSDVTVPMSRTSISDMSAGGSSADQSEDDESLSHGNSAVALNGIDEPRYDTSSKQRVQSWTDRILYRSNVVVDEEADEDDHGIDYFRRPSNIADAIRDILSGFSSSASTTLHKSKTAVVDKAMSEKTTVKLQRWQSEAASKRSGNPPYSPSKTISPFADVFKRNGRSSREPSPDPAEAGVKRSKSLRECVQRNPSLKTVSIKKSGSHDRIAQLRGNRQVSADDLGNDQSPELQQQQQRSASLDVTRKKSLKFARNEQAMGQRKPRRPSFHLRSSSSSRSMTESNSLSLAPVPSAPLPATRRQASDGIVRDLPRSSTQASARSVSGATSPAGDAGLGRIKSFFHLPSLSFFQTRTEAEQPVLSPNSLLSPVNTAPLIVGPRKGRVEILQYDAVSDMGKMGAVSDHRPVFAVAAVGIGGKPVAVRSCSE